MNIQSDADRPRHPIQVVARRTGLTPDVLRAWERRYQAVTPHRTDTSRRMYSDRDVERLILLRSVTGAGRAISQVAGLSMDELRELTNEDTRAASGPPARAKPGSPADERPEIGRAMEAVGALDAEGLRAVLAGASLSMTRTRLLDDLVIPLVEEIGERWHAGTLRIAAEHLATSVIQSFLTDFLRTAGSPGSPSAVVVVATPVGQRHQLGALMAAAAALSEGWGVIYLGSNLPAEEIAAAAVQKSARAIALSLVYPPDDPMLPGELRTLRDLMPAGTWLAVGGRAATAYQAVLSEVGASLILDLVEFGRTLSAVRSGGWGPAGPGP